MKQLKTILIFLLIQVFFYSLCIADKASVTFGVASWQQEATGHLNWQGSNANLETGFKLDDDAKGFIWLKIEHPVPGLPNIGLVHSKLGASGSGTVSTSFSFGGTTFNVSDSISSSLSLDQTDLIFYYEIIDTKKNHFDLGLLLKYIDGNARAENLTSGLTEEVSFEGVIPMLYANLQIELPYSGLSFGVEGSAIGYSGNSLSDFRVNVAYRTKSNLGIELGYRRQAIKLDDLDNFNSDFAFQGVYFGASFKF